MSRLLTSSNSQEFKSHLLACRQAPGRSGGSAAGGGCFSSCAAGLSKLLQKLGIPCYYGDTFENSYYNREFYAKKVRVEGVEQDLAYARAGSSVPASLQGIFWLDMFYESSVAKSSEYKNKPWWTQELANDEAPGEVMPDLETLVCFGDHPGRWDAAERTMRDVGYCGDRGHWTFPDTKEGEFQQSGVITSRMNADVVFQDAGMTEAWVSARVKVPGTNSWLEVPRFMFEMMMYKADHGWNRKTTLGNLPDFIDHNEDLKKLLPSPMFHALQRGEQADWWNYPMVQIVDGNGSRTKHYDEYVAFMRKKFNSDYQLAAALKR